MTAPAEFLTASRSKLLTARIATVLAAQFLFGLAWSTYLVVPKFLATELHADPQSIARVTVMGPLVAVLILPVALAGMDRWNRAWIFRAGASFVLVASIGYVWGPRAIPVLGLFQAMVGVSYTLAYNASASVIADDVAPERLGEAVGLLGASNVVANALATTLAERLATAFGWATAFETSAAMALLALALSMRLRDDRASRASMTLEPLGPALRGPLGLVLVAAVFMGATFSAMFTFHQPYVLLIGGRSVSPFFVGFTTTAVLTRVLIGSLGDRYGHREVSVGAALGYGTVALAMTRLNVDYLWAYGLAFGAAHGILYPTLNTHGVLAAPAGARGRVFTVYGGAFNVGVVLATLAWGKIAATVGFPALFMGAALAAYAGALVLMTRGARVDRNATKQ
jgi:predicted MFS family arabinose efflux permease